jgi:hypothetical protein
LGYAALTQGFMQRGADERAHSLLGDEIVVRMKLQFRNKLEKHSGEDTSEAAKP